jgi:hypothetical protein
MRKETMTSPGSSSRRFVVFITVVLVFIALVFGSALLAAEEDVTQASPLEAAKASNLQQGPVVPDPLTPRIATPEPGQSVPAPAASTAGADIEVVEFRPQIRLQRGQLSALAQSASKPDSNGTLRQKSPNGGGGGPQEPYQAPDIDGILAPQGWTPMLYEDFEGVFPGINWILSDLSDDGRDITWGDTDYYSQAGSWSIWPAAGGIDALDPWSDWYTDTLSSWAEYKFDFSGMSDVFASFGLWYDTEPQYDWMYFCASIDFSTYDCDYWSGYSGGWEEQSYWLTSYAGYSEVWLAWVFESDDSISEFYEGPFVDEVYVWGYDSSTAPTPTPTPDPQGELVQNGSFETGDLTNWQIQASLASNAFERAAGQRSALSAGELPGLAANQPASPLGESGVAQIVVTNTTSVHGMYSTYLWQPNTGDDFLFQTISVPTDTTDITINYWFAVTTAETSPGNDWFCVSLSDPLDHSFFYVDLGCMDAYYTTGYWQEVLATLTDSEVSAIVGKDVDIVFELYNRGQPDSGTAGWVDYVRVYATGPGSGSGSYLDANEPNDTSGNATVISCDSTISGVIGDEFGSYGDEDWFILNVVPVTSTLDIDIDAETNLSNPSNLDSMLTLYDSSGVNILGFNDDDGFSYDSFIHYTDTLSSDGTYYIQVESYSGYGGPDHPYDLKATCNGAGQGTPPTDNPDPGSREWTVILYLNAEDSSFAAILSDYIHSIESYIGGKSGFLDVVALYDGPNDGDTVRYHIQSGGATVSWPQGELNMGDPDTLSSFASWAMDLFPAENYYLAIDDHGHGVYGISWDQTNGNDSLTPPEVYSALKDATNNGARKIDIFDYEACLMGMAEHAYDVSEWVDYVVFFEQISWGLDTYPNYFSSLQATDTPQIVGQNIITTYFNLATGAGYPHTISLIDTSKMAAVKQATTDLGAALEATGDITTVNGMRNLAQAFAAADDATNPDRADYIDLWDLADKVQGLVGASLANSVKLAVEDAVVTSHGITLTLMAYPSIILLTTAPALSMTT